jgi:hypothetical protein
MSRKWWAFLFFAFACGAALRLLFPGDMEWKEDEYYNYIVPHLIAIGARPWPWVGMNSGVYIANPGMSVWTFAVCAKVASLFGADGPLGLATTVRLVALLGSALVLPLALGFVPEVRDVPEVDDVRGSDRLEPWLWTFAFAMVNPFLIYFHRKLWPQAFLPIFCVPMLAGWYRREKALGAFTWGCLGALVGQVHMAGFFSAAALVIFTVASERHLRNSKTKWKAWFVGSCLGALPLLPWFAHLFDHPTGQPLSSGLGEVLQFKFWVFWVTDALGLHLGNPLGLNQGTSLWGQISDFARYPVIAGHATWFCGAAHAVALAAGLLIIVPSLVSLLAGVLRRFTMPRPKFIQVTSDTELAQRSMLWGFGGLLTITGVNIRRYYMAAAFPFEALWLSRLALDQVAHRRAHCNERRTAGRWLLAALWIAQLVISADFVGYIHVRGGALEGDYGEAYHVVQERHFRESGETWPDLKLLR